MALEGPGVLDLESWPWLESLLEADEAWTASDTWEAMAEYLMRAGVASEDRRRRLTVGAK